MRRRLARLQGRRWFPWAGGLALNALLLVPAQLLPGQGLAAFAGESGWREVFVGFWASADVLAIATLVAVSTYQGRPGPGVAAGVGLYWLAWAYELYDVFIQRTFSRSPVLYDDVLLLDDAVNLVVDLAGPFAAAAVAAFVAAAATVGLASAWLVRGLARHVTGRSSEPGFRVRGRRVLVLGWSLIVLIALERSVVARDGAVQSSLARLGTNIGASLALRDTILALEREPGEDTDARFAAVRLRERPNVYLFMVESYGRASTTHQALAGRHAALLAEISGRLASGGWHAATSWSDAPVFGGASWLAAASVLGGVRIDDQHLFNLFLRRQPYGMIAFFASHGYETVGVLPGMRERPGMALGNTYGFGLMLSAEDLAYRGPGYGWGVIPDQYSLEVAAERVLAGPSAPLFFYFAGVSSHAPWTEVPALVGNWRELNATTDAAGPRLLVRLGRKLSGRVHGPQAGGYEPSRYQDSIEYELRLIAGFVETHVVAPAVVLVVGDHQPPYVAGDPADKRTPLHVIASDPNVADNLKAIGFHLGLTPPEDARAPLAHEAIFSLLVQVLARVYGAPDTTLPPGPPAGMPRAAVLRPRAGTPASTSHAAGRVP